MTIYNCLLKSSQYPTRVLCVNMGNHKPHFAIGPMERKEGVL